MDFLFQFCDFESDEDFEIFASFGRPAERIAGV